MDTYSYIANADVAAIETLYEAYQQNPESVDFGWRKFFEGYDFSQQFPEGAPVVPSQESAKNGNAGAAPAGPTKAAPVPGPVPQPDGYGVLNTNASTNDAGPLAKGAPASDKETAVKDNAEKEVKDEENKEDSDIDGEKNDEPEIEYPAAWRLVLITIALCFCVFCVALVSDQLMAVEEMSNWISFSNKTSG